MCRSTTMPGGRREAFVILIRIMQGRATEKGRAARRRGGGRSLANPRAWDYYNVAIFVS